MKRRLFQNLEPRWHRPAPGALKQGALSLAAGAATTFAFAPYDISVIPFITLALLFHIWRSAGAGRAFINGYLFGLGLFGVGVNWLHISINLFSGINLVGAWLLTFLLVAWLSLFPALTGLLGSWRPLRSDYCFFLLLMPSLWVLGEWLRSWLLTGFPWLTLGYTQMNGILSGYGSLVGVFGVSFMVALLAGGGALLAGKDRRLSVAFVMLLALAGGWQLRALQWTENTGREIDVALIQGAVPQEIKWQAQYRNLSLELYPELTGPFWGKDLIIWPETAIPGFPEQLRGYLDGLERDASHAGSRLLVGLPTRDPDTGARFNSMVMLGGGQEQVYNKRRLVPFGEYLPLKPLLQPALAMLNVSIADFSPGAGDAPPLFHADGFAVGLSICYEAVFGAHFRSALPEAETLINISNDAWFGASASPHQHLQMARMRAIESGRYLLRATNTGISAVIDEKGRIVGKTRQFEADAIATKVPLFTGRTLYALTGDIPILALCLSLLAGALLFSARKLTY